MTNTVKYGHSTFAAQRVHAWLPDKPGFYRAICGIQLADTLITAYPRPTRDEATWCPACYLVSQPGPGGEPRYVMRRSVVDGGAHVIPAGEVGRGRTFQALCGHGLSDAVARPESAYACESCVRAAEVLVRQEVSTT
ncbi:hypothetical protein [Goodfellowiella coeruleoviolacea]|uniref:Uncharacterized protein n=1 Tax=Goodfellowiella coeruleoviolacea TaxID=334858 RepID=A0AAE3KLJ0_9PSEU|nr:hypothetical protein [Goodfellowiella coeruleoviolacea]MCP2170374.1 hypothetical protein [Goodfellowiella coeruleoviolacea]